MKRLRIWCGRWTFVRVLLSACAMAAVGCRPSEPPAAKTESKPEVRQASAAERRALELTSQSGQLMEQGNLDAAIAKAAEAIDLAPRQPAAYEARGLAYQAKKDYRRARADFEEATRLMPGNGRLNFRLGILYLAQNDTNMSRTELSQAIAKGYGNPLVMLAMGDVMAVDNRLPEALEAYDRALLTDPDLGIGYVKRGRAKLRDGKVGEARADFAKARSLKIDVDDAGQLRAEKQPEKQPGTK